MKQNPERPRSGSRPAQPVLGRFAVEPRLPAPLNDDGVCAPLLLAGGVGRNGDVDGGNEVLLGPCALRLVAVGSPPKNPTPSRSSWNMSTNSCCSSSKLSCTEYTDGLGQRTDLDARGALQILASGCGRYRWRGLAHHVGHLSEEVAHPRQLRMVWYGMDDACCMHDQRRKRLSAKQIESNFPREPNPSRTPIGPENRILRAHACD